MTEIPEHLRKRAEEARLKAAAAKAEPADAPAADASEPTEAEQDPRYSSIRPAARRPRAARPGWRPWPRARWRRRRWPPPPAGGRAGGHTQRLLTVVVRLDPDVRPARRTVTPGPTSFSIEPWPPCLHRFVLIFSIFVNARCSSPPTTAPQPLRAVVLLGSHRCGTDGGRRAAAASAWPDSPPRSTATPPTSRRTASLLSAVHHLRDVVCSAHHHRLVLPRPGAALRLPLGRGSVLRAVRKGNQT